MELPPIYTFDLETHPIEPGAYIPKPVAGADYLTDTADACAKYTLDIAEMLIGAANTKTVIVVGHNVSFDMSVMCVWHPECAPAVWKLYEEGRVSDTEIREKLIALRGGILGHPSLRFNLAALVKDHLNIDIEIDKKGADSWRLRYKELDGVPFEKWPAEAMQYMLNDARLTHAVWLDQLKSMQEGTGFQMAATQWPLLPDEARQVRADFALQWTSARGMIADPDAVNEVKTGLRSKMNLHESKLREYGVLRINKDGSSSKNLKLVKELVVQDCAARKVAVPMTEPTEKALAKDPQAKGNIQYGSEVLEDCIDPQLLELKEWGDAESLYSKYVENILEWAAQRPMHPNFDVLKETGRTSSFGGKCVDGTPLGFNCQQLPRKGGFRECFVPRPGYVFIGCDYSYIEICAFAQVLYEGFGHSRLRDELLKGRDPHVVMAAGLEGVTYEAFMERLRAGDEAAADVRQFAKVPNFGFPGGLGSATFVQYAKGYGFKITHEKAEQTKAAWLSLDPAFKEYFNFVSAQCDNPDHCADVPQLGTERIRGRATYTQMCNSFFQGMAADGLKEALWLIAREMYGYSAQPSPLRGCFMVAEAHDEIIAEAPEATAWGAANRLQYLMLKGMKKFIKDVPVLGEPVLMRRWYKGAKPVCDAHGRLIPWEPKKD